ncbi:phage recombination protein [Secundilactobacillus oryzae JCM 18671]|uniref:Phage recombination protein n=1 Tax=Secundilactobacillus oryzae JCM 18671 TaxID=1291743 RepID=A0A081BI79_9LACO|nr:phage recombination protein Bet [Secundilactobacillus oryzae]GAK47747.1 phage recombination protein [Secundilactobacillus oryzae JCM 18671]
MAKENTVMTTNIEYEVNGEAVKLNGNTVREYLVSGNGAVSDQEVVMFMQLCRFQKLNPFLHEAYLVKFGNNPAQIIVSKEAFMKRANSNPHFKGVKAGIMVARDDKIEQLDGAVKLPKDVLIGGWATVQRDDREETHVELALDEFSKGQSTWKSMPNNMIRKTAMVNALREAFPESLGDMYTEDDKNPADNTRVEVSGKEAPHDIADLIPDNKTEKEPIVEVDKPVEAESKPAEQDAPVEEKGEENARFTEEDIDIFANPVNGR